MEADDDIVTADDFLQSVKTTYWRMSTSAAWLCRREIQRLWIVLRAPSVADLQELVM